MKLIIQVLLKFQSSGTRGTKYHISVSKTRGCKHVMRKERDAISEGLKVTQQLNSALIKVSTSVNYLSLNIIHTGVHTRVRSSRGEVN